MPMHWDDADADHRRLAAICGDTAIATPIKAVTARLFGALEALTPPWGLDFTPLSPEELVTVLWWWEHGLTTMEGGFTAMVYDYFASPDVGLSDEVLRTVREFMEHALLRRLAAERSLSIVGWSHSHEWIYALFAHGSVFDGMESVWSTWWSSDHVGHAVASLQFISLFVFGEDDNPIFAPRDPEAGGGPFTPLDMARLDPAAMWREANMPFLTRALTVERLSEQLEFRESSRIEPVARLAAGMREVMSADGARAAEKLGQVLRLFGEP